MVLFRVVSIGSKKEDPLNNLLGIAGLHNVCDYPFEAATSHIQNTNKTHNIIIWLCSTDKHDSEQYKPVPWKSLLYEWHYTAWETFINIPIYIIFLFTILSILMSLLLDSLLNTSPVALRKMRWEDFKILQLFHIRSSTRSSKGCVPSEHCIP